MKRNIGLDITKLILSFMVVGIHTHFLKDISSQANQLLENGLFTIAVPVFLLINGFFFYDSFTKNKVKQWFKYAIFLYLFWTLFYSFAWFDINNISFIKIFKICFFGYMHLWYLTAMIGAGFMSLYFIKLSLKIQVFIAILLYMLGIIFEYIYVYYPISNELIMKILSYPEFRINFLFVGFPYFFTGILIKKYNLYNKITITTITKYLLVSFVLLFTESLINFNHDINNLFSDIFVASLLLIFLLKLNFQGNSKEIASYSAGVYFIHFAFVLMMERYFGFVENSLSTLIVFALSLLSTFFFLKLKSYYIKLSLK